MKKPSSPRDVKSFKELIRDKNKKLEETNHLLARMFRTILAERGIGFSEWDGLIDRYYRRLHTNRHGEVDVLKANQDKSNLVRALAMDSLPFNRFETAIQILGPKKYFLTLRMEGADGNSYSYTVGAANRLAPAQPRQPSPDSDEDEEDGE